MDHITMPHLPVLTFDRVRALDHVDLTLSALTYTTTVAATHVPRVWKLTTRARVPKDRFFSGAAYEEIAWGVLESNWLHGTAELLATAEAVVWDPTKFSYDGLLASIAAYGNPVLKATALRLRAVHQTSATSAMPQRAAILGDVEVASLMRGHGIAQQAAAHCLYNAGTWSGQMLTASIGRAVTPDDEWKLETVLAKNLLMELGFTVTVSKVGPVFVSHHYDAKVATRIDELVHETSSTFLQRSAAM